MYLKNAAKIKSTFLDFPLFLSSLQLVKTAHCPLRPQFPFVARGPIFSNKWEMLMIIKYDEVYDKMCTGNLGVTKERTEMSSLTNVIRIQKINAFILNKSLEFILFLKNHLLRLAKWHHAHKLCVPWENFGGTLLTRKLLNQPIRSEPNSSPLYYFFIDFTTKGKIAWNTF
jgi:hypothetical protein